VTEGIQIHTPLDGVDSRDVQTVLVGSRWVIDIDEPGVVGSARVVADTLRVDCRGELLEADRVPDRLIVQMNRDRKLPVLSSGGFEHRKRLPDAPVDVSLALLMPEPPEDTHRHVRGVGADASGRSHSV